MFNFSQIQINYQNWKIIFLIMICIIIIFIINNYIKTPFVIPNKLINFYKYFIEKFLLFGIISLILLILLDLQIVNGKEIIKQKNLNIQILFDVSLSMSATDITPSRFDGAQQAIMKLNHNLTGYNISIITFSGIPFVRAPFSNENGALAQKLAGMNLGEFPPTINFVGTAIGDAILLGINNLIKYYTNSGSPGLIILITDGDSNKGNNPTQAANIARKYQIPIFTLGIGSNDYIVGHDYMGFPVKTSINIDLLNQISKTTNGKFYRVIEDQDFENIFSQISQIVKAQEKEIIQNKYFSLNNYLYKYLLIFIFFFLVLKIYIIGKYFKNII